MSIAGSDIDDGPMLGALLRMAHAAMTQEYAEWLASSKYDDIQPAHAAVIQPLWQRPDGARLTELARTARITKQSIGALVDSLEKSGYVERVDDPDDRRAWRVRLTKRGRNYATEVRAFALDLEKRLAQRLGARRLEELRATLKLLVSSES